MSVQRALLGASKYQKCRYSLLKICTKPIEFSPCSPNTIISRPLLSAPTRSITRTGSSFVRQFASCNVSRSQYKDENGEEMQAEEAAVPETTSEEGSVPWYLRVQEVDMPENTLIERQRLPAIPEDSPSQLKDIVSHLSEGIGLEYLTLLDLRELDPPPALGSNLVMIIGTARSTRHLNVSADRFCRWLRSTYDLSPHADGLLGRNELKLKLRRRARRAKILGNKLRPSDGDDGITTGWICVNIGVLGGGTTGDLLLRNDEGSVIGFGQNDSGTNVVVQFLTEEKRESLDLEGLWDKYLDRQRRRIARLDAEPGLESLDDQPALFPNDTLEVNHSSGVQESMLKTSRLFNPTPINGEQRRGLHVASGSLRSLRDRRTELQRPRFPHRNLSTSSRMRLSEAFDLSLSTFANDKLHTLSTLPSHEAIKALGTGCEDEMSTPFLRSFHGGIGPSSAVGHHYARLGLIRLALNLHHPGYSASTLIHALNNACESLVFVPENLFEIVLCGIAQSSATNETLDGNEHYRVEHIVSFITILEEMSLRGTNFYTEPIMDSLFDTVFDLKKQDPEAAKDCLDQYPLAHIALLADQNQCTLSGQHRCMEALKELIKCHKWTEAWRVWSWFPMREEGRPASLYITIFHSMAETRHQTACMDALTKMVPTMDLEIPPVKVEGDTAAAMMECLKVADPGIEARHARGEIEHRPWVSLFETCVQGLQGSDESAREIAV